MVCRISAILGACGLTLGLAAPGQAQLVRGPELLVNVHAAGRQSTPDVAMAADGRFVVVWVDGGVNGALTNVMARLFLADGTPRTGELRVSTTEAGFQGLPRVAMAADGRFVVVWQARTGATAPSRVYGRLFRADGQPVAQRFRLGTAERQQFQPDVARTPDGKFVAAWTEDDLGHDPQTGDSTTDVLARRFAADGRPVARDWIAAGGPLYQYAPAVAVNASGAFAIAVETLTAGAALDDWETDLRVKVYGSTGSPLRELAPLSLHADANQGEPAVALAGDGACVLAWTDSQADDADPDFPEDAPGVLAQKFDALGRRVGTILHVNTSILEQQSSPAVALGPNGSFLVAWTDSSWRDGDGLGVFVQRFLADGARDGAETALATWTTGAQSFPAAAAAPDGRGAVAWQSERKDGADLGIAARRVYQRPR